MAVGWYLTPYVRKTGSGTPRPGRFCNMQQFDAAIRAEGGTWSESEVLGDIALVKVVASTTLLAVIQAAVGIYRFPKDDLNAPLTDLSNPQVSVLENRIELCGYSEAEWQAALGTDLRQSTLRKVLNFIATRRLKPRYDAGGDDIILDGPVQVCLPVQNVDRLAA